MAVATRRRRITRQIDRILFLGTKPYSSLYAQGGVRPYALGAAVSQTTR